jgi:hypothetical protein
MNGGLYTVFIYDLHWRSSAHASTIAPTLNSIRIALRLLSLGIDRRSLLDLVQEFLAVTLGDLAFPACRLSVFRVEYLATHPPRGDNENERGMVLRAVVIDFGYLERVR